MTKIDDLLQRRIGLPDSESRRRRNHEPPKSETPKRKKTWVHTRLSCKIDYLLGSNHRDRLIASEFFTDDQEGGQMVPNPSVHTNIRTSQIFSTKPRLRHSGESGLGHTSRHERGLLSSNQARNPVNQARPRNQALEPQWLLGRSCDAPRNTSVNRSTYRFLWPFAIKTAQA